MRARSTFVVMSLLAAVPLGGVFSGEPATPAAGAPAARAARSTSALDDLDALEERMAMIRVGASRSQAARLSERVWPARGAHTGWWGERRGGRAHAGLDIDGDSGDPIVAAAHGTVSHAGPAPSGYSGYGLMVVIDHGSFSTLYAHLDRVDVVAGQIVDARHGIGVMGTTGSVTGSHLHFETRVGGVPVNPARFMAGAAPF